MVIAKCYGAAIEFAGLPPKLTEAEEEAIAKASLAVAQQYGPGFQHWPLVALASALTMPVIVRYGALKAAMDAEEKIVEATIEEVTKD